MSKEGKASSKVRFLRVAMVSSVHRWNDTRVFFKEAVSLAREGHKVILVGVGPERATFESAGVLVFSLPRRRRAFRWKNWISILRVIITHRASVVHAHDPELIPLVLLLKLIGCKVVCDIHEDFAEQVLHKEWIPRCFRKILSRVLKVTQRWLPRVADAVILAEDSYRRNFPPLDNVSIIRNFPLLPTHWKQEYQCNIFKMIYVGDIRIVRGIEEYIKISDHLLKRGVPVELRVVGSFADQEEEKQIKTLVQQLGLDQKVKFLGRRPPKEIPGLLEECDIGLALLHPIGNYRESYPTKMFEYMAAGLPVVASRFALWENILVGNDCGRVVDPRNIEEAAEAIFGYWVSMELRERHGRNGRSAVVAHYHWDLDLPRLIAVYSSFVQGVPSPTDHL